MMDDCERSPIIHFQSTTWHAREEEGFFQVSGMQPWMQ
jgi:hypothetical protein